MTRILTICIAASALAAAHPVGAGDHSEEVYPPPSAVHACGAGVVAGAPAPRSVVDGVTLTIEVRDAGSGALLAARVAVRDGSGAALAPPDPAGHLFQSISGASHFYCEGAVSLPVPPGPVTVKAGCGFEYVPAETTVTADSDGTVVIALDRIADMNAVGWYAGDTHVHISHPPVVYTVTPEQVIGVMKAEGLNVVNAMEEQAYFAGALHPASTPERLLRFGKEERNAHFGHLSLMGLHQWIPDQTCDQLFRLCGRTPSWWISELVRSQGPHTLIIATHPFPTYELNDISPWPGGGVWRAMTLDILGGHVDAMDLMNYTHAKPPYGAEDYFHALNLGFRVAPSAGTDATIGSGASYPAGGYRVYAWLEGEALTFERWVEAVREGRSFVTNYPLFRNFTVNDARPGDELAYAGGVVTVRLDVICARPFDAIEIIADGEVVHTIDAAPGTTALGTEVDVDPGDAGWVLARVRGASGGWHVVDANGLFAQTAPVFLAAAPVTAAVRERGAAAVAGIDPLQFAAHRFRYFTESIVSLYNVAVLPPAARAEFDSATAYAIDYFKAAWPDPPGHFDLVSPLDVSWAFGRTWQRTTTPTFRWRHALDPDPGDSVSYEFQLDTDNTFDNPEVAGALEDTVFTAPPEWGLENHGVYYWRVVAVDELGNRRISTPAWWSFIIDMTITDAGDAPPGAWGIDRAFPNPFNPSLRVTYSVPPGAGEHRLEVFDARGHLVRTLFEGVRPAGVHEEVWTGRDRRGEAVVSGVYFIRLSPRASAPLTYKAVLLK